MTNNKLIIFSLQNFVNNKVVLFHISHIKAIFSTIFFWVQRPVNPCRGKCGVFCVTSRDKKLNDIHASSVREKKRKKKKKKVTYTTSRVLSGFSLVVRSTLKLYVGI